MIWNRAQGLPDSKNKIPVPLWLLSLLNRLTGKSEQTPELNKTDNNHFLKADSAYASDQGSVQGALEASLWQVARWPLCIFYVNFWLCNTSALLKHFFVNSLLTIIVSGQRTRWWSCSPAREQIQGWERHSWTPLKIMKLELFLFHLNEITKLPTFSLESLHAGACAVHYHSAMPYFSVLWMLKYNLT